MSNETFEAPRILIVDDTPQNLQFLEQVLRRHGYRVFALPSGKLALAAAARNRPQLILLDIVMPELDGYEVCQRLKADPELRDIPVIFLSALDEPLDKMRAFQAGGVDYITKPFQIEEVEARVKAHLELSRQRHELQIACQRLREVEQLRESFTQMIVHDLRSPLTAIGLTLDLVSGILPGAETGLKQMVAGAQRSTQEMSELLTQLLDISRLEAGKMPLQRHANDLSDLASGVLESVASLAGKRRVLLESPGPVSVSCDASLITRVLRNLVVNAFKFTPDGAEVRVCLGQEERQARVAVTDTGNGIPAEFHEKIFEKFGQVAHQGRRQGTGLGLAFCKLAVEAHGGRIGVDSQAGQGSTFWFLLPPAEAPSESGPGDRSPLEAGRLQPERS